MGGTAHFSQHSLIHECWSAVVDVVYLVRMTRCPACRFALPACNDSSVYTGARGATAGRTTLGNANLQCDGGCYTYNSDLCMQHCTTWWMHLLGTMLHSAADSCPRSMIKGNSCIRLASTHIYKGSQEPPCACACACMHA